MPLNKETKPVLFHTAQLTGAVEYTDCFSAEGGKTPPQCPGVPVMLELWVMQHTPFLPSLPGPLWPGVVVPDKVPIYGLNRTKQWLFDFTDFLHLNCVSMLN